MPLGSHVCSNLAPAETGLFVVHGSQALREQAAHGLTIYWPEELTPAPPIPLAVLTLVSEGCRDPQIAAQKLSEQGIVELPIDIKAHLRTICGFYGASSVSQAVDLAIDQEDILIERHKPEEPLRNRRAVGALIGLWIKGESEKAIGTHIYGKKVHDLSDQIMDHFGTDFLPAIARGAHEIGLLGRERFRRSNTTVFALTRPMQEVLTPEQAEAVLAGAAGQSNEASAARAGISLDSFKTPLRRAFSRLGAQNVAHATTLCVLTEDIKFEPEELPARLPTRMEIEVALRIACGMGDAAIAGYLNKSVNTIKTQRSALAKRLHLVKPGELTKSAAIVAAMWRTNMFVAATFPASPAASEPATQ